jgi:hypothetical protein
MGELKHIGDSLAERNIVITGADVFTMGGFTQVPNALLRSGTISPGAKLCYAMLLSYAWHNDYCFPGQERLATDMGVTDRSVRSYLKELEGKKLLTIKQRGLGKSNVYTLDLRAQVLR